MNTKKCKRVLSLSLIMIMILLSFSGCGKGKKQNDGDVGTEGKKERETLTIGIQTYSFITDYKDNYLTKKLEEELDINIEFHLLSADSSEVATQLSLLASANQKMPDIICTGSISAEAVLEYGSKGIFVPLNDWITDPQKAPNFNSIASEEDRQAMLKAATSADGNIYSLVTFEPEIWNLTPYRMYINEVWLNQLGQKVPTTTEEYYQVLKAFTEGDPNGNGKKDEIGVYGITAGTYGENVVIPLMNSFIYMNGVGLTLDEEGKNVMAPFAQDEWKEGLTYLNKLCTEGLLPASIFTDDRTQFMSVLNNEEANLVGSLSTGSLSRWNNYDTNENGQEFVMMPPLAGPEGKAYSPFMEYRPAPIWFITSSCKNPELALKLGDLFYRKDFSNTARYGEEGIDWTTDEAVLSNPQYSNAYIAAGIADNITLVKLKDIWSENNNKFWRNINPRYASIEDGNTWANAVEYDPDIKSSRFYADNYAYNYPAHPEKLLPSLTYTNEEAKEQAEIVVNITTYVNQSMAQFITGALPLSEWDNYIKELERMGLSTWLSNAQAAYERN